MFSRGDFPSQLRSEIFQEFVGVAVTDPGFKLSEKCRCPSAFFRFGGQIFFCSVQLGNAVGYGEVVNGESGSVGDAAF